MVSSRGDENATVIVLCMSSIRGLVLDLGLNNVALFVLQ